LALAALKAVVNAETAAPERVPTEVVEYVINAYSVFLHAEAHPDMALVAAVPASLRRTTGLR
jgi:hypothetical protein